jgi:hypothetical protein
MLDMFFDTLPYYTNTILYFSVFSISVGYLLNKIKKQTDEWSKDQECDWYKFWNLYDSVFNQTNGKYSYNVLNKLYAFYHTSKIVAITKWEDFVSYMLLKTLKEISLSNNKILIPLFLHDKIHYICIEKVSNVREYDIINVSKDYKDQKIAEILNRYISGSSSPYRITSIKPIDLEMDKLDILMIKNNDVKNISIDRDQEIVL